MPTWKMKKAYRQFFPRRNAASNRFVGPAATTPLSRHAWAIALATRFANRLLPLGGEQLIFERMARNTSLFIKKFGPNIHVTLSPRLQSFLERQTDMFVFNKRITRADRPRATNLMQLAPMAERNSAERVIRSGPSSPRQIVSLNLKARPVVQLKNKQFGVQINYQKQTSGSSPATVMKFGTSLAFSVTNATRVETSERIRMKGRRVEDNPFRLGTSPAITEARPLLQTGPTHLRTPPRNETKVEPDRFSETAPTAVALNVTQVTDEVLRQLDRRLISTRERMGRI